MDQVMGQVQIGERCVQPDCFVDQELMSERPTCAWTTSAISEGWGDPRAQRLSFARNGDAHPEDEGTHRELDSLPMLGGNSG